MLPKCKAKQCGILTSKKAKIERSGTQDAIIATCFLACSAWFWHFTRFTCEQWCCCDCRM